MSRYNLLSERAEKLTPSSEWAEELKFCSLKKQELRLSSLNEEKSLGTCKTDMSGNKKQLLENFHDYNNTTL